MYVINAEVPHLGARFTEGDCYGRPTKVEALLEVSYVSDI